MNKTHRKKLLDTKNGFTLVEVLVVIFIMGFLITATAVSYSRVWLNNQIDTAETELRNMSGAFSSYMIDYGNITVGNDINYETVIGEVVEVLNKQYLSFEIVVDEIAADRKSVRLFTKIKADPWGRKYQINIYTYDGEGKDSISGLVVIASRGADGISQIAEYKENNFGDDIAAIIEPK